MSSKSLLAGGLAVLAAVAIVVVWLLETVLGIGFGLTATGLTEFDDQAGMYQTSWYTLYFTEPRSSPSWSGGLDAILAQDIDNAHSTCDIAAYDFDLQSVADAVIRAHRRGVQVRVVMESENVLLDQPQDLIEAGVPLVKDDRGALMHNKFVVIDDSVTWTGSWNLTENGTYRNDNNAIRFESPEIAANFTSEFEEMFLTHQFGPGSPAETPNRTVIVEGSRVEVYFAPEDQVLERVIEVTSRSSKSIRFLAYSFTDDRLGTAIRERGAQGVLVEGVMETRNADSTYSEYELMRDANLDVWLDGNPASMHHKVIVVDGHTTIVGSFNFSQNASESNDENLLIIHDQTIARRFLAEFDRVVAHAR